MRIAVAAATRRRPDMLATLLQSFKAMDRPDGAEIGFVIAENDEAQSEETRAVVDAFRAEVDEEVTLLLEPRPGIPLVRNCALDFALEQGFDFMTFVDDDEEVSKDWLTTMIAAVEARDLDLAGGPLEIVSAEPVETREARGVLEFWSDRAVDRNKVRRKALEDGTDGELNIFTNNWCARLATVRRLGQRFDDALQYSGGSDTKFSQEFLAKGARLGWVPGAVVRDRLPPRRLTYGYLRQRTCDQRLANLRLKRAQKVRSARIKKAFFRGIAQSIEGIVVLVHSVVAGPKRTAKAMFKLGTAKAEFSHILGRRNRHYAPDKEHHHV